MQRFLLPPSSMDGIMDKNLRPYLVELVGTFAFVFLAAGAVIADQLAAVTWHRQPGVAAFEIRATGDVAETAHPVTISEPRLGLTGIALAAGLAYAAALAFTVPYSGGYLNPAVPLTLWVLKRLDGGRTVALVVVQLLGAILAGGVLRLLLGARADLLALSRLGTPHLNTEAFAAAGVDLTTLIKGVGVELGLTFLLVFAIFGTGLDPRARQQWGGWVQRLLPLWLGILVTAATFFGFGLTGAAANPARWLGTAVWELTVPSLAVLGPWQDHPVYWVGPVVGALLAGSLYSVLVLPPEDEPTPASATPVTAAPPVTSTLYRTRR